MIRKFTSFFAPNLQKELKTYRAIGASVFDTLASLCEFVAKLELFALCYGRFPALTPFPGMAYPGHRALDIFFGMKQGNPLRHFQQALGAAKRVECVFDWIPEPGRVEPPSRFTLNIRAFVRGTLPVGPEIKVVVSGSTVGERLGNPSIYIDGEPLME